MLSLEDLAAYETQIRSMVRDHHTSSSILETLIVEHARREAAQGSFTSVRVPAAHASDTAKLVEVARRLERAVAMPNVVIEVPATDEGLEAFEIAIAEGISAGVDLITSPGRYRMVIDAYFDALEHRVHQDRDLRAISSHARLCVAPIVEELADPMRLANANASLAGLLQGEMFTSERWKALSVRGARVQPLLVTCTSGQEIEEMNGGEAKRTIFELGNRGFNTDEFTTQLLFDQLEQRKAEEAELLSAIEAMRRALPAAAPGVPDARNSANLGVETFANPRGYDLDPS